ncbi:DUF962 domain-containing protein [Tenacibaculum sp. UWU-22]|uniref:Mpo1 family 2-hydroxy fatty acid dioxygenase n=1 Tax=Tenacibaculum sp. UWU-22 TaxID=3234187 RepID=UPI0034DAC5B2
MKTATQWFNEYEVSHQNKTNKIIHYFCVPAIFFSVIGLLMSIPPSFLTSLKLYNPLIENWAFVIGIFIAVVFYLPLQFWYFLQMLLIILVSIVLNFWISNHYNLPLIATTIFIIAWIAQFYGHKIEGKKPSFFKDLQFLLIGPLWVIQKITNKNS